MHINWTKVLTVGTSLAGLFVPGLQTAVQVVEQELPQLKGPDKKTAALTMAQAVVTTIEGAVGKDVLDDARVQAATSEFVDAYVSAMNAEANLRQAITDAQAARVSSAPAA